MHQVEIDHSILRTLLKLDECKRAEVVAVNAGIRQCRLGADAVRRVKAQLLVELQEQLSWKPTM